MKRQTASFGVKVKVATERHSKQGQSIALVKTGQEKKFTPMHTTNTVFQTLLTEHCAALVSNCTQLVEIRRQEEDTDAANGAPIDDNHCYYVYC